MDQSSIKAEIPTTGSKVSPGDPLLFGRSTASTPWTTPRRSSLSPGHGLFTRPSPPSSGGSWYKKRQLYSPSHDASNNDSKQVQLADMAWFQAVQRRWNESPRDRPIRTLPIPPPLDQIEVEPVILVKVKRKEGPGKEEKQRNESLQSQHPSQPLVAPIVAPPPVPTSTSEIVTGRATPPRSAMVSKVSPHRQRLVEFYQQHNPEKLSTVDETLIKFAGRESEMFDKLEAKYTPQKYPAPPLESATRCFLEFPAGRVVFQLFNTHPFTSANFRVLCGGNSPFSVAQRGAYHGSHIHRIVPNFVLQFGDYTAGDGTGGGSIFPRGQTHPSPTSPVTDMWGNFVDEEPFFRHDGAGLLSMANNGRHRNGSQVFITLRSAPLPSLDGKHVVFGRVVDGMDIVREMARLPTDDRDRPLPECQSQVQIIAGGDWPVVDSRADEADSPCRSIGSALSTFVVNESSQLSTPCKEEGIRNDQADDLEYSEVSDNGSDSSSPSTGASSSEASVGYINKALRHADVWGTPPQSASSFEKPSAFSFQSATFSFAGTSTDSSSLNSGPWNVSSSQGTSKLGASLAPFGGLDVDSLTSPTQDPCFEEGKAGNYTFGQTAAILGAKPIDGAKTAATGVPDIASSPNGPRALESTFGSLGKSLSTLPSGSASESKYAFGQTSATFGAASAVGPRAFASAAPGIMPAPKVETTFGALTFGAPSGILGKSLSSFQSLAQNTLAPLESDLGAQTELRPSTNGAALEAESNLLAPMSALSNVFPAVATPGQDHVPLLVVEATHGVSVDPPEAARAGGSIAIPLGQDTDVHGAAQPSSLKSGESRECVSPVGRHAERSTSTFAETQLESAATAPSSMDDADVLGPVAGCIEIDPPTLLEPEPVSEPTSKFSLASKASPGERERTNVARMLPATQVLIASTQLISEELRSAEKRTELVNKTAPIDLVAAEVPAPGSHRESVVSVPSLSASEKRIRQHSGEDPSTTPIPTSSGSAPANASTQSLGPTRKHVESKSGSAAIRIASCKTMTIGDVLDAEGKSTANHAQTAAIPDSCASLSGPEAKDSLQSKHDDSDGIALGSQSVKLRPESYMPPSTETGPLNIAGALERHPIAQVTDGDTLAVILEQTTPTTTGPTAPQVCATPLSSPSGAMEPQSPDKRREGVNKQAALLSVPANSADISVTGTLEKPNATSRGAGNLQHSVDSLPAFSKPSAGHLRLETSGMNAKATTSGCGWANHAGEIVNDEEKSITEGVSSQDSSCLRLRSESEPEAEDSLENQHHRNDVALDAPFAEQLPVSCTEESSQLSYIARLKDEGSRSAMPGPGRPTAIKPVSGSLSRPPTAGKQQSSDDGQEGVNEQSTMANVPVGNVRVTGTTSPAPTAILASVEPLPTTSTTLPLGPSVADVRGITRSHDRDCVRQPVVVGEAAGIEEKSSEVTSTAPGSPACSSDPHLPSRRSPSQPQGEHSLERESASCDVSTPPETDPLGIAGTKEVNCVATSTRPATEDSLTTTLSIEITSAATGQPKAFLAADLYSRASSSSPQRRLSSSCHGALDGAESEGDPPKLDPPVKVSSRTVTSTDKHLVPIDASSQHEGLPRESAHSKTLGPTVDAQKNDSDAVCSSRKETLKIHQANHDQSSCENSGVAGYRLGRPFGPRTAVPASTALPSSPTSMGAHSPVENSPTGKLTSFWSQAGIAHCLDSKMQVSPTQSTGMEGRFYACHFSHALVTSRLFCSVEMNCRRLGCR
jgi:peptidyl-prolyl isomerase H (cyclophilin H)